MNPLKQNKKALGLSLWTGIGFLFAVILFIVFYAHPESVDKRTSIGTVQLETIKAKYQAEKALLFLDYSAKYALPYAILQLGEQGGMYSNADASVVNECGSYVYQLWNMKGKKCIPEADKNLKLYFNDRLNTYLRQYPGLPVENYDYQLVQEKNSVDLGVPGGERIQKTNILTVQGFSRQDLTIPILVEDTGQAKLSDFGGALRFPVQQANPVIISCYGDRDLDGKTDYHDGIDIAVPEGTPVLAVADGAVESLCGEWVGNCACSVASGTSGTACKPIDKCSGKCSNYGNNVIIKHADTLYSRYSHLKEIRVQPGQNVKKGDTVGISGNTGYSQGAHLDLKIYTSSDHGKDSAKNPFCFYSDSQLALLKPEGASCAGEIVEKKISKQSPEIQGYCEKIEPGVLQNLKVLEDEQELSQVQTEQAQNSGTETGQPAQPATTQVVTGQSAEPATKLIKDAVDRINSYQSLITAASQRFDVEENLIKAIMYQESKGEATAASGTGAKGLMQVTGGSWKNYCVKKGIVETDDWFDPQLNILCGTFILTQKFKEGHCEKAQPFPRKKTGQTRCCADGVCSEPGKTYIEWECAVRGYNTADCDGADPLFVEKVMSHYRAFGGQVIGLPEIYTDQLGTYSIPPNFKAEYKYNLDDYKTIAGFVSTNIIDSYDGSGPEEFLAEKITAFNQQNPDLNMTRYCEAPLFYEFAEKYLDCLENGQKECVCEITLDNLQGEKDMQIMLLDNYFSLQNPEDIFENHRRVEMPYPVAYTAATPESQRTAQLLIQYMIGKNSKKFTKAYKNSETELTFITDNPQHKPICTPKKTMYSLCVEQKNSFVKTIEEQKLIEKPVKIRFSVSLEDTIPPSELQYEVERSSADPSAIILSWAKPAGEEIDHYNLYIGETLAELADLSTTVSIALKDPEKTTLPIEQLEPDKFYYVEKEEPPKVSITYYYIYKPQIPMPTVYIALTAVDRNGNELKTVQPKLVQ
ncbi:MAG: peptidoglycan DD-metalloendopeptidase family protein [Nanoarchaeota archaeon]